MKRKRILHIGVASIFAFFLALTGCAKSETIENAPSKEEPLSIVEEEPELDKEAVYKNTGELSAKASRLVYPTATLKFEGESNVTMAASPSNNAASVGLKSSIFTVLSNKCDGSYNVRMFASDHTIRIYGNKDSGDGGELKVSIASGYSINSIVINFFEHGNYANVYDGNDDLVTISDGSYLINSSSFIIKNCHKDPSAGSNPVMSIENIVISYVLPTAREIIEYGLTTTPSLSYEYTKDETNVTDIIDKTFTGVGGSYTAWSDKTGDSGVVYAGYASGSSSRLNLTTTEANKSGIIVTNNETSYFAKRVTLTWNAGTVSGRKIDVYGKSTAYSSASDLFDAEKQGTLLGSMSFDREGPSVMSLKIDSEPLYIGIRSHSDALYLDSVDVVWGDAPTYDYSNAAIRFGNLMEQTLWDRLDDESTIKGYGVMLSTPGYLSGDKIKEWYADNSLDGADEDDLNDEIADVCGVNVGAVKNFYTKISAGNPNPSEATAAQKGDLVGDYYIWNLYKGVATANLTSSFTAVAYIRVESGIVFLNEVTASVKSLARDLIDDDTNAYDEDSFEGSLNDLANLA